MPWTEKSIKTLKILWARGQSANQIAKEIGNVTRNAVIGKVHRLGLPNRSTMNKTIIENTKKEKNKQTKIKNTFSNGSYKSTVIAKSKNIPPNKSSNYDKTTAHVSSAPSQSNQNITNNQTENTIKNARKLHLMQLTEKTCKWPIGDPEMDQFFFCGLEAEIGKPYCQNHNQLAYQTLSSRRERRK